MHKLARTIEGGSVETVKRSAEIAKAEQLAQIRKDSGGDLRLSGVNKAKGRAGNAKLNVRYRVRKNSVVGATAFVTAVGPLQIINNDTAGRVIRSAWSQNLHRTRNVKGSNSRGFVGPVLPGQFGGGRRAVLQLPDGNFRRSVRHPGTKGKGTWQAGRKKAEPKIRDAMSKRTTTVIAKGMKG